MFGDGVTPGTRWRDAPPWLTVYTALLPVLDFRFSRGVLCVRDRGFWEEPDPGPSTCLHTFWAVLDKNAH